jgi:hypothetical protein
VLAIFPLFSDASSSLDYRLADEAITASDLVVQEVGEHGSVPELLVENKGEQRVLFLEGEQLIGAKQNRILNTSILIAAKSKTKIPVSCVEQGRWRYTSKAFAAAKSMSGANLRYALKSSVSDSLKTARGHSSDQGAVWREVARQQDVLGTSSGTAAMSDTYKAFAKEMKEYQGLLKYVDGACGVAVAVGPKVLCFDLFDKPTTCCKVWDTLLSGFVMDALESAGAAGETSGGDVEQLLADSAQARWQEAQAVGEGQEYRTEFGDKQGSALTLDGTVVHLNVVAMR